ncbi:hypothetical protein PHLGIDRAFT_202578 [Phlebiopsis gigantea 11061_1 CR5-6]|uniref:Uncharacterized protein n=1 Tax=Phlebiopsis gigantea (strain 11061_1 CR5-6) TaxID=745531 RepID=A0A0C3NHK3_PHLG1|nr:hypothetical protein PHLGIDRAFT_202578 [Phlebiopsis gigantea 11061_1 CR5-6]
MFCVFAGLAYLIRGRAEVISAGVYKRDSLSTSVPQETARSSSLVLSSASGWCSWLPPSLVCAPWHSSSSVSDSWRACWPSTTRRRIMYVFIFVAAFFG